MKGIVNMEFSDLVALKLKEILEEKNITLYKLQSLTGVYSSTVSQFLTRKTKTIRIDVLFVICNAINVNLSNFFLDDRFKTAEATEWKNKKEE